MPYDDGVIRNRLPRITTETEFAVYRTDQNICFRVWSCNEWSQKHLKATSSTGSRSECSLRRGTSSGQPLEATRQERLCRFQIVIYSTYPELNKGVSRIFLLAVHK